MGVFGSRASVLEAEVRVLVLEKVRGTAML